jgi:hypothetical protein
VRHQGEVILDLPLELGMADAEVRARLDAAGVVYKAQTFGQPPLHVTGFSFEREGHRCVVIVDVPSDSVRWLAWTRVLADLDAGLEVVRERIADWGRPAYVHGFAPMTKRLEVVTWHWADRMVTVLRSADRPWTARVSRGIERPQEPDEGEGERITLADVRAAAAAVRVTLDAAELSDANLDVWRERIDWRVAALERFADGVAATSPDAEILSMSLSDLPEHAGWLARHRELFDQPDDWRAALVVTAGNRDDFEADHLGWTVEFAVIGEGEGKRTLRCIRGPFATGVHRVARPVEELYPLRDDLPVERVHLTALPPVPDNGVMLDQVEASLDGMSVRVAGFAPSLERLARLLVAARVSASRSS